MRSSSGRCSCCVRSPRVGWPTRRKSSTGSTASATSLACSAAPPCAWSAAPNSRSRPATTPWACGCTVRPPNACARCLPGVAMTGLEPWVLFGDSMALGAHARYATGDDEAHGRALFATCRGNAVLLLRGAGPRLDYPVAGQLLFALGAWALLRRPLLDKELPVEVALRLLALAHRFAYNRTLPTMMWERIVPAAEEAA